MANTSKQHNKINVNVKNKCIKRRRKFIFACCLFVRDFLKMIHSEMFDMINEKVVMVNVCDGQGLTFFFFYFMVVGNSHTLCVF